MSRFMELAGGATFVISIISLWLYPGHDLDRHYGYLTSAVGGAVIYAIGHHTKEGQ